MYRFALTLALVTLLLPVPANAQDAAPAVDEAPVTLPEPDADALECRDRRERLARAAGPGGVVVVFENGPASAFTGKKRSDDFFYLCSLRETGSVVVAWLAADPAGEATFHDRIYVRPRNPGFERWNGTLAGPGDETAARYAFDDARSLEQLDADVAELLRERDDLVVSVEAPADGRERLDTMLEAVDSLLGDIVVQQPGQPPPTDPAEAENTRGIRAAHRLVVDLRAVKSEREIGHVRHAVEATVEGINDVLRTARPELYEYQLQALVEMRCLLAGCMKQAFPSIVGSGPNSCILHYSASTRQLEDGDLVVLDVGGEYEGYAADVTRTFPVSGTFTEEQARVYDAVLEAQLAGLAAVKPGATLGDIHRAAREVLVEHDLAQYFFHGTSHSVGLNVHDPFGRTRKLEPGAVLTVEPGAYIAAKELGVRIEDTVVVTETGCIVLSAGAPKTREAIEAMMAEEPEIAVEPPR